MRNVPSRNPIKPQSNALYAEKAERHVQEYFVRLVGQYRDFIEPDSRALDPAAPRGSQLPPPEKPQASSEDDGYVRCDFFLSAYFTHG